MLKNIVCDVERQYPEGTFNFDNTKARKTAEVVDKIIEETGNAPYDYFPMGFYDDRERPTSMLLTVCNEMNSRWAYHKFEMTLPSDSMRYIEENFGDQLPVLSGDWSDQWDDFATIAPSWFAQKRDAERMLPVAETLSVIAALEQGKPYPEQRIDKALWRLCEFDDHCWATSSKHPVKMHRFNLNLFKKESAKISYRNVSDIINSCIGRKTGTYIKVWNTVPHRRKASLRLTGESAGMKGVGCQELSDGSLLTEPLRMPAYGFVTLPKADSCDKLLHTDVKEDGRIETPFYTVFCNTETQKITSIIDKQNGQELLDAGSNYSLGDFIYTYSEEKHKGRFSQEIAERRSFEIRSGPLAVEIINTRYETQIGANVNTVIRFYTFEKNIDIELKFENATGLMGDNYDRYKKNIFFAFPFSVPGHHFVTELAGGVVDETTDRLPVNPHDFVLASSWVAAENDSRGIALYSKDMPVFHLGGIHYNELSSKTDFSVSSNMFLYAASNRCNQLNFVSPSDCSGHYHLSVLPYVGTWSKSVPEWSMEKDHPLLSGVSDSDDGEKEYFSLDNRSVRMLALKKCEDDDSIIVRFLEVAGNDQAAVFHVPFDLEKAEYTNLIEEGSGTYAEVNGREIAFRIERYSYAVLKLTPKVPVNFTVEQQPKSCVCNIFSYTHENNSTIVCFEKCGLADAEAFDIYADGRKLCRVPNEKYKVQYCQAEGVGYTQVEVIPVFGEHR